MLASKLVGEFATELASKPTMPLAASWIAAAIAVLRPEADDFPVDPGQVLLSFLFKKQAP